MKVGILTHPLENNYGGLLQAFALQTVIRRMGHDVYTIDRHNQGRLSPLPRHLMGYIKRCYRRYAKGDKTISTCWDPRISLETKRKLGANMWAFVERNLKITDCVWSSELAKIEDKYQFDAYVVGSDQVWLPSYCPGSFLDFVTRKDVIKFSYAASCSCATWTEELTAICRVLAKSFKGLSVREDDLVDFCKTKLGKSAIQVLDPTLLLVPSDYLNAIHIEKEQPPIVFSYILDNTIEKQDIVQFVSECLQIPSLYVNSKRPYYKRNDVDINDCIFPSVEQWLMNLNRAKFVVTDSFHGVAMSIVFNKPFVAIANSARGISRFNSILKLFGLESRLISTPDQINKLVDVPIDYSKVNETIREWRNISLQFIKKMLNDEN